MSPNDTLAERADRTRITAAGCATATTTVPWRPSALSGFNHVISPRRERDQGRAVVGAATTEGALAAPVERRTSHVVSDLGE